MDHGAYRQGLRQRIAQVCTWLLGRKQTHDHYRHSARHQADGSVRGQQDPDAGQQDVRQARDAFERHQPHQGGWRHGR